MIVRLNRILADKSLFPIKRSVDPSSDGAAKTILTLALKMTSVTDRIELKSVRSEFDIIRSRSGLFSNRRICVK